jgi:hypothetical protein
VGESGAVLRELTLQPSSESRYSPVAQVVEIGEKVAFISFKPALGRCLVEPGQITSQVSRVGIDRLGSTGEPAKPNHERTSVGHGADSRVEVPPDPVSLSVD